jgi:hypothetical protein
MVNDQKSAPAFAAAQTEEPGQRAGLFSCERSFT